MSQKLALLGGKPIRSRPFTAWPIYGKAEEKRLLKTLHSGKWGRLQGDEVSTFERRFAAMHGCQQGICIVNGTVSLRISLIAAGIRADDEVIVPPYTFFSTASAVIEANAVPVFADIDLETFNLNPKAVEAAITPRTKAIIPVHFAGQPADMNALMAIAAKHKLTVIEDAAHAHGASYQSRPAGSLAHLASFSFQSSKNLTCGEGGIITSNDNTLAEACRSIHNCGRVPQGLWYEHHVISGNNRLGEFQAAILNCQLDRLESQTKTRDRNGQYLASRISKLPGIHPQKRSTDCTRHSYHLFMLRLDSAAFGAPRATVIKALQAEGIPCSGGYAISLHKQPMFQNKAFGPYLPKSSAKLRYDRVECPNSDLICREQGVWFEQSMFLGTRTDMDDIAAAFEKIHKNRGALENTL
ncbi:MAG TPA: DegT/DnrJ/EryC1/StrS family aminotransferase [Candidatus Limnocylindria bacterium]|jgi:dTDP-4-amino-4,6-dideoxygalactose transaminase|nr:DegT/DnrJ/EryC1/StrS family aminotransferase [Candidatus Limnocylindria bacterium]